MCFILAKKIRGIISASIFIAQIVYASDLIELEPISLKNNLLDFPQSVFVNRENIAKERGNVSNSISDLIESKTNIDIRQRGIFDIQSDLNIRASSFEQNLIVIDGISLSDPQTSHYSMDIPIKDYDWQTIGVLKGLSSSIYGSHAIGGVIEIDTVVPKENKVRLNSTIGEKQLKSFNIALDRVSELLDYHVGVYSGSAASYREETDFSSLNIFSKFILHDIVGSPKLVIAKGKKTFGASSFYSSNYPKEEEDIETDLYMVGFDFLGDELMFSPTLYLRRHWDKFILDRSNPSFFKSIHTNYIRGIKLPLNFNWVDLNIETSLELREEDIDSTNLGKHERTAVSLAMAISRELSNKFNLLMSMRLDDYSGLNRELSPGLYLKYRLREDESLFLSLQRAYRIPSFTELYYSSPANLGAPDLSVEDSLSVELGYSKDGSISYGALIFRRLDHNLIDWVRESDSDPWRAQNVSFAKTDGAEGWFSYNDFKFAGSLFNVEHKSDASYSKYVANYLQYRFSILKGFKIGYFDIGLDLNYQEQVQNSGSFNLDLVLSKNFVSDDKEIDWYFKIMNLTGSSRSDLEGVLLPGRWMSVGLEVSF